MADTRRKEQERGACGLHALPIIAKMRSLQAIGPLEKDFAQLHSLYDDMWVDVSALDQLQDVVGRWRVVLALRLVYEKLQLVA